MLSPQQTRMIAALLAGRRIKDACRKAGVSPRTYRDWKGQDEFRHALADAQKAAWSEATGLLKGLAPQAVRKLRSLLNSKDEVALRTALGLLDRGTKAVEVADVLARLDVLEAAAAKHDAKH
jgi:hypothetical protein